MDITRLSANYTILSLTEKDIPVLLSLCEGNPQFYRYCPPAPSEASLRQDMLALPPGKTMEDKFYLGFWLDGKLAAVLDLILRFPNEKTAFIGFFMLRSDLQGRGVGSQLVNEICTCLRDSYQFIRLGYAKGNPQSQRFWHKNGFVPTGVIAHTEEYDIVMMEKLL